jgi:NADH-quinone oxidoreductase subunit L
MSASLLILIPLLPLLGFIINGIGFRRIPKSLAGIISSAAVVGSFIISIMAWNSFGGQPQIVKIFDWISIGSLNIPFSFQIDQLSLLMLLVVTGVGSLIHIYSIGYMSHDKGFGKFFAFLNLFIFFMLLLVMGSNYVIMFIGWEGVGLCSYLLIGFWNTNTNYNNAARKAFIMNRIGDLGFLLGIFMIIQHFGSVEYNEVFAKAADGSFGVNDAAMVTITMLLFVGAMGKSAQIPLYTWLPDAMAGPTPVSALIHAATMVTAGIYMVVRSNVLYSLAPMTLGVVGGIGLMTALVAASIGLFQNDIKKVLAYSTVSQLGYMFLSLGVGAYSSAMFHVITHAFFKALLFLGAGSVIHAMSDEQDIRNMGGLRKHLPITFITFLIATIAIAGIFPFSGFFSKDEILAHVFEHNKWMWALGILGAAMTAFYMFRLLFVTFFGKFRGTQEQAHHLHESPATMTTPLMVLAVLSALGGLLNIPHVLGGGEWLSHFMSPLFDLSRKVNPAMFEAGHLDHTTEHILMVASVGVALLAIGYAYHLFMNKKTVPAADENVTGFAKVLQNKYYVDEFNEAVFVKPMRSLSNILYSFGEFFIDLFVNGTGRLVKTLSSQARLLQTGETGFYVFAMVTGILITMVFGFYNELKAIVIAILG